MPGHRVVARQDHDLDRAAPSWLKASSLLTSEKATPGARRHVQPLQLQLHVGAVVAALEEAVFFFEVEQRARRDGDDQLAFERGGHGGFGCGATSAPVVATASTAVPARLPAAQRRTCSTSDPCTPRFGGRIVPHSVREADALAPRRGLGRDRDGSSVERPSSRALPKAVIQARRISRGASVGQALEHALGGRRRRSAGPSRGRRGCCGTGRSAIARAASRSGADTSNTFMRFRIGSGMARSSFAVATQITWLASIATSANSSVKLARGVVLEQAVQRAERVVGVLAARLVDLVDDHHRVGVGAVDQRLEDLARPRALPLAGRAATAPSRRSGELIETKPMPVPSSCATRARNGSCRCRAGRAAASA